MWVFFFFFFSHLCFFLASQGVIIGTRALGLTPMQKDPSNGDAGFPEASWMADVQRTSTLSYWIRLFPNPNSLGHLTRMRKRGPWRCDVAVWTGQGKQNPRA